MTHRHVTTNSEVSLYHLCRRRWWYRYPQQLAPESVGEVLNFGRRWHQLLDIRAQHGTDKALEVVNAWELEALEFDADEFDLDADEPLSAEKASLMTRMFVEYCTRWADDGLAIIATEHVMRQPVINPRSGYPLAVEWSGIADQLVMDRYGQYWVKESKTTRRSAEWWIERHAYNPQAATYGVLLAQAGIQTQGVIYDLAVLGQPASVGDLETVIKHRLKLMAEAAPKRISSKIVDKAWEDEHSDFTLNLDGGLSKTLPKHTTREALKEAHDLTIKFGLLSREWVAPLLMSAEEKSGIPDAWEPESIGLPSMADWRAQHFVREYQRWEQGELDRRREEMAAEADMMRQASRDAQWSVDFGGDITVLNTDLSAAREWPRNGRACHAYNRQCEFFHLCRNNDPAGLVKRTSYHAELEQENQE